jgi:hypothetical protein
MFVHDRARRGLLAVVLTASLLALAAGSASATRLAFGEPTFRVAWAPMRFVVSGLTISCHVTLEGSFDHTTIAKVEGSRIGDVTRVSTESCSTPNVSVLTETVPWHVEYGAFTGTLPDISTVTLRVIGMGVGLTIFGTRCIGRSEERAPALMVADRSEATGTIADFRWDESAAIPLTGPSGCLSLRGRLSGTSSAVTGQGNTRAIALTLIG